MNEARIAGKQKAGEARAELKRLKAKYEKAIHTLKNIAEYGGVLPSDGLARETLEDLGEV